MSDQRIRELERAFGSSGSLNDEAALLRERLRLGLVTHAMLLAAATCSSEVARLILSVDAPLLHEDARERIDAIISTSPVAAARVSCLATSQSIALIRNRKHPHINSQETLRLMTKVTQGVSSPEEKASLLDCRRNFFSNTIDTADVLSLVMQVLVHAAQVVLTLGDREYKFIHAHKAVEVTIEARLRAEEDFLGSIPPLDEQKFSRNRLTREQYEQRLLWEIEKDLTPWALGHHDPLTPLIEQLEQKK